MPDAIVPDKEFHVPDEVIEAGIDRVLSVYSSMDIQVERDWLRREVRRSSNSVFKEVSPLHHERLGILKSIEYVNRDRGVFGGRRGPLRLVLTFLSLIVIIVGIHTAFQWTWPVHYINFGKHHKVGSSVILAVGTLSLVIAVALSVLHQLTVRNSGSVLTLSLEKLNARYNEALLVQVQQVTRTIISERVTQEESIGVLLYETDSSGLVETTALQPVDSANINELERFVREHTTSAIGIAGPRGCGKTTVINRLTNLDGFLGVYIPAPVYYEAADFTRTLHAEVAKRVLRHERVSEARLDRRMARSGIIQRLMIGIAWIGVGGLTLFLEGLGLFSWARESIPRTTGFAMVGVGAIICAVAYIRLISSIMLPRGLGAGSRSDPATLALDELRRLRWKTSLQTKDKHSFKLLSVLTTDSEDQIGLDQYDRSHPERVSDLRDFLLELRYLGMPPILIAIDELDKMASPEKAIDAVNGLKDLFHITDTHFVVSVSEDALDSFALRGVPARDVFDSSFDTVIRIQSFTAADSWSLIESRAPRFNEWAALLCHVVTGGLPRDLIRAARRCVGLCIANGGPQPVAELAVQLVKDEAMDVVEAAIRRTRSDGTPNRWLMFTRRNIEESSGLSAISLDQLFTGWLLPPLVGNGDLRGVTPDESSAWIEANVGVLLLIMVTVAELFGVRRSSAGWRAFAVKSQDQLENLAAARASLAISHIDALDRLRNVRRAVGLGEIPSRLISQLISVDGIRKPAPEIPSDSAQAAPR